jgi:hypothetical protein
LDGLDTNPLLLSLRWQRYGEGTNPYFAYINDPTRPPFISSGHATRFLHDLGVVKPIHDLFKLWLGGLVHTSITALTHDESTAFTITWHTLLVHGVVGFDVHARRFNEGIEFPNVGMAGLRDFAHVVTVETPFVNPEPHLSRSVNSISGRLPLPAHEGLAILARSIAETLIVAVHGGIRGRADDEIISSAIATGLEDVLREEGGDCAAFMKVWKSEGLHEVVTDVRIAIATDVLQLRRFVRSTEQFILSLLLTMGG